MAIRPIDMQVSIPRSGEVLRADQNLANRSDTQRETFSRIFQEQSEVGNTKVQETSKAEQNAVDKDGRNKEREEKRKNKKNKASDNKKPEKTNLTGSKFDFTV